MWCYRKVIGWERKALWDLFVALTSTICMTAEKTLTSLLLYERFSLTFKVTLLYLLFDLKRFDRKRKGQKEREHKEEDGASEINKK